MIVYFFAITLYFTELRIYIFDCIVNTCIPRCCILQDYTLLFWKKNYFLASELNIEL